MIKNNQNTDQRKGFDCVSRLIKVFKNKGYQNYLNLHLKRLQQQVRPLDKILILHDIAGTLLYKGERLSKADGQIIENHIRISKHKHVYLRPGALDYIRILQKHPRVVFGFYSSMALQNIKNITDKICEHEGIGPFEIFDRQYCSLMKNNPKYTNLKESEYDTYRDFSKLKNSDFCRFNEIVEGGQVCMIDNEVEKLQSCIKNAILSEGYTAEDVLGLPNLKD